MKTGIYLALLMVLWICPASAQTSAEPAAMLLKANESYLRGDYANAEVLYRAILDTGLRNGKVYYNLGNALFRQGRTGEAIQHYLLARRFIPRNEDLEANLGYARQKAEDRIEPSSSGVVRNIVFWYDRLSVKELSLVFLACNLLFWSGLCARLFWRRPVLSWLILGALVVGGVMGGTAAARAFNDRGSPPAVIIAREVLVRSGMDPESATLFVLHDGAEVDVEKESGDWSLIRFGPGKKGWVRNEQLGPAAL